MSTGTLMARTTKKAPAKAADFKTIGVRSSPEWSDWVERLAKAHRTTVAGVIDRALTEWALDKGFDEHPPERVP